MTVCSYKSTFKECQNPANRIKALEQRLSRANDRIAELQHDQNNELVDRSRKPTPLLKLTDDSTDSVSKHISITAETVDIPLIQSLLGSIMQDDGISMMVSDQGYHPYFHKTRVDLPSKNLCQLPTYETALAVVYAAFKDVFALSNVVEEQAFRFGFQKLYDVDFILYTKEDMDFMPLFYAVIALGMIKCFEFGQKIGHEMAHKGR